MNKGEEFMQAMTTRDAQPRVPIFYVVKHVFNKNDRIFQYYLAMCL